MHLGLIVLSVVRFAVLDVRPYAVYIESPKTVVFNSLTGYKLRLLNKAGGERSN